MRAKTVKRVFAFLLAMILSCGFLSSLVPVRAANTYTLEFGMRDTTDDSEEWITGDEAGSIDYNSSDLEIGSEKPDKTSEEDQKRQIVAVRFADLTIPQGAVIDSAYIQFTADADKDADGTGSKSTNPFDIKIYAEDTANASPIKNEQYNISSRSVTSGDTAVSWNLDDEESKWTTILERGEKQRTPDVSTLIQYIIDKDGWASGNALCFQLRGTGNRTAASSEDAQDLSTGPVLHVTFTYDGTIDHAAPTGLTGVAPTSADGGDGKITGTTAEMEYKLSSAPDTDWAGCGETETTGLAAGDYQVRHAATSEYNASAPVTVTVPAFVFLDYTAQDITLQPGADESKMNFCWYSSGGDAAAQVQIAPKSAMTGEEFPAEEALQFDGTAAASGSFTSNEVSATGLTDGTEYVYRVGDGTNFSGAYSFKTQDGASYSALLMGDPQIGSSGSVPNDQAGWQNTLTNALAKFPDTSFILSAGDQVEHSTNETEYTSFFTPDELRTTPLVPTIGNHDNGSLYQYHYDSPNESDTYGTTDAGGDYWFTYGNTLYMVLNSNNQSATSHDEFIGDAIDAAGSGVRWKIVMFHHSIYSSATHSTDSDILSRRSDLYPVFDKYDIDVVLMGHDHCYTRSYIMKGGVAQTDGTESSVTDPDGILYVTANSSSGSKYYDFKEADTVYSALRWQGKEPSYSNIEVTDTSFTIKTYRTGSGDVIDAYTINKKSADVPSRGGTGGATTKPPVESSTRGDTTTATGKVTGSLDGPGKATGSVDAKTASALIDAAKTAEKAGKKAVVEIKLVTGSTAGSMEVTVPKNSFDSLATGTDASLTVSTDIGTATFDPAAVDAINSAATSDIKIRITQTDASDLSTTAKAQIGDRPVYDFGVTSGSGAISSFGDGHMSIRLPYTLAAGEDPNAVVVYYISDGGELKAVRGSYDPDSGMVQILTTHFSKYAVGYHKVTFSDVGSKDWYYNPVTFLAARGVTTGTTAGTFSPNSALTRGQFLVMLLRAYGIEADANPTDNFSDAGSTYYTNYLAAAKRLGISNGMEHNKFAPDREISRQDMFTLLYRTLDVLGELPEAAGNQTVSDFRDAGLISGYAQEAVSALVEAGVVSGSNNLIDPLGVSTRAQMAQVLYHLLSA